MTGEMYPARSDYFIGFEIDEQQAMVAMANGDPRIRVFPHSFLIEDCTPAEIAGVRSFFRTRVSSTFYILHYLNNFNYWMSVLCKDNATLEAKHVMMIAKEKNNKGLIKLWHRRSMHRLKCWLLFIPCPDHLGGPSPKFHLNLARRVWRFPGPQVIAEATVTNISFQLQSLTRTISRIEGN